MGIRHSSGSAQLEAVMVERSGRTHADKTEKASAATTARSLTHTLDHSLAGLVSTGQPFSTPYCPLIVRSRKSGSVKKVVGWFPPRRAEGRKPKQEKRDQREGRGEKGAEGREPLGRQREENRLKRREATQIEGAGATCDLRTEEETREQREESNEAA